VDSIVVSETNGFDFFDNHLHMMLAVEPLYGISFFWQSCLSRYA